MKRLLLKIVFRLLDGFPEETKDELAIQWLIANYSDPGFHAFVKIRTKKLHRAVDEASLIPEPRDKFLLMAGQRFEHARLIQMVKSEYNKAQKEKK